MYNLIAIDTETTGLGKNADVIEVYAVEFDIRGNYGRSFHSLCKPSKPLKPIIKEITGLDDKDLENAPTYSDIKYLFKQFIGRRTIVAHNSKFDLEMLGIPLQPNICTLSICRQYNKKGNSLSEACRRYNVRFDDGKAHRAEYDAFKCAELYCKLMKSKRVH